MLHVLIDASCAPNPADTTSEEPAVRGADSPLLVPGAVDLAVVDVRGLDDSAARAACAEAAARHQFVLARVTAGTAAAPYVAAGCIGVVDDAGALDEAALRVVAHALASVPRAGLSMAHAAPLLEQATFRLRSHDQAMALASFLAPRLGDPARAMCALAELFLNAIEHGNLGLDNAEKTRLLYAGELYPELDRRLALPENRHKEVVVTFESGSPVRIRVVDAGPGFDWRAYVQHELAASARPSGRGIGLIRALGFTLDYVEPGNQAVLTGPVR